MRFKVIVLTILAIAVMLIPTMAIPVYAVGPDGGTSTVGSLVLDNKDGNTWQRLADGKYAVLTYNSSGPTFNFSLSGFGLGQTPTAYSLIYFADPYPGNFPGALIGTGNSLADGTLTIAGTPNLGIDLPTMPDSNMVVSHAGPPDNYQHSLGAKIWLIPSVYYSTTVIGASGKVIGNWNSIVPSVLFETDLILYTDTDKAGVGTPLTTTVTVPPASLGLTVSPITGFDFGSVAIGTCSSPDKVFTLNNVGTVPIRVTAIPSAGFYATSLKFGDILAKDWTSPVITPATSLTVNAKVCPIPGLTGVVTGSVIFVASFAP
jgi:hypothetical protein